MPYVYYAGGCSGREGPRQFVWGISSCKTDIVRLTRKPVRFTHITDFAYNGQKTLVPSGPIYARFTVAHWSFCQTNVNTWDVDHRPFHCMLESPVKWGAQITSSPKCWGRAPKIHFPGEKKTGKKMLSFKMMLCFASSSFTSDETFPLKSRFPTFEAENCVLGFVQICNKNGGGGLIQGQRLGSVLRYPATTWACHVQI
jgi:hypothetical protein